MKFINYQLSETPWLEMDFTKCPNKDSNGEYFINGIKFFHKGGDLFSMKNAFNENFVTKNLNCDMETFNYIFVEVFKRFWDCYGIKIKIYTPPISIYIESKNPKQEWLNNMKVYISKNEKKQNGFLDKIKNIFSKE